MAAPENRRPGKAELNASHQDPANWKWGVFYYNKADHRLMPPKRIPELGFTINFANRRSVLLLICMIIATAGFFGGLVFLLNRGR